MSKLHSSKWIHTWILAIGTTACAPAFSPADVPKDQGTFFGNIHIVSGTKEFSDSCKMTFTDEHGTEKVVLTPDESGWVAVAVKSGRTYLSGIQCSTPLLPTGEVELATRDYAFDVPGDGKITYFGNIRIEILSDASKVDPGVDAAARIMRSLSSQVGGALGIVGVLVGGGMAMQEAGQLGTLVTVKDLREDATAELEYRHPGEYRSRIVTSLAGLTSEAIAQRKAAVEALQVRIKQIDEAWAAWAKTHPETACADAFKKLEGDAECGGQKCQEPLTFLEGYKKNCELDTNAKIAVQRWRLRWGKQIHNQ